MQKLLRLFLLLLTTSSLLSACGFHLLGTQTSRSLPQSVAIVGNTDNTIVKSLKEQKPESIRGAPTELADLTLDFGDVDTGQTVLSKTQSGTVSEYRVSMSVIVQVYDAHKKPLLAPTRLSTSRNLIVGTGYATAQDTELERLNNDMARELANSIIYRVRAVWFAQQKVAP